MPTFNGTAGSDFLVGPVLNDTINGLTGSDVLVGDLFNGGAGHPDLILECEAGVGANFVPVNGADNVSHSSHNDQIDDGPGNDLVVGDAFAREYGELQLNALSGTGGLLGGDGGNFNSVSCFSDFFIPGPGNDQFIGDVYHIDGQDDAELNAAAGSSGLGHFSFFPHGPGGDGGNGNVTAAFNDAVSGGEGSNPSNPGNDLLVGDVFGVGGRAELLNALAGAAGRNGGDGGTSNAVLAFNDQLFGDTGSDRLVGDVYGINEIDDTVLNAFAGTGGGGATGGDGGNSNSVNAFADIVDGGVGTDQLIGDVLGENGSDDIVLNAFAGTGGDGGGDGGSANSVSAFGDILDGGTGPDQLIGDALGEGGSDDMVFNAFAGTGGDGPNGGDGGDNNSLSAFADILDGGTSGDVSVGDAFGKSRNGDMVFNAFAGTGGDGATGGDGGNSNSVNAFADILGGGTGGDTLIGDVFGQGGHAELLNALAGAGGLDGGDGGSDNAVGAFNDQLIGDIGSDRLVGDVYDINGIDGTVFNAFAGTGGDGATGGDGGDNNSVGAFADILDGGTDGDQLIGDALGQNGNDDMVFNAFAGTGGDGATGGDGGNNNSVNAFADMLLGGTGADTLIGDAYQNSGPGPEIDFFVKAGAPGSGGSLGGTGNAVNAFSDRLVGDQGNDILVGDARRASGTEGIEVTVAGTAGNTISAFQDYLDGGLGNDQLYGDFFGDTPSNPASLNISGSFTGRNQLFADSLNGDIGSDQLTGGLGADTMTGGLGKDYFFFVAGDLFDLSGGVPLGTPPVDLITDFRAPGSGNDVLDFSDLLSSLGFVNTIDFVDDWLTYQVAGSDSTIFIDQDGLGGAFTTFEPMLDLTGFISSVVTLSVADMVLAGEVVV